MNKKHYDFRLWMNTNHQRNRKTEKPVIKPEKNGMVSKLQILTDRLLFFFTTFHSTNLKCSLHEITGSICVFFTENKNSLR